MTTETNEPRHRTVAGLLHERLSRLRRDADRHHPAALAKMAKLRRAAGQPFGSVPEADAALLSLVPFASRRDGSLPEMSSALGRLLDDLLLVASLVAVARLAVWREGPDHRGSFGKDLRRLHRSHPRAAEHMLIAALGAEREDLDHHLRRAAMLLGSEGRSIDVGALVLDLGRWNLESRWIQKRWALDFWAGTDQADNIYESETT